MSISHVFQIFKKISLPFGVFIPFLILAGCAGGLSKVQTWEGENPGNEVAVLETPGDIRVTRVNGHSVTNFLLDDLDLDYELLPGSSRVEFVYRSIWAKSRKTEGDERPVHVVASEPQIIRFEAVAGETYQLVTVQKPETRREAEVFAAAPEVTLVDPAGKVIARAEPLNASEAAASAGEGGEAPSDDGSSLERLKAIWEKATAAERQEFLRWALD